MNTVIFSDIPFRIDRSALLDRLRLRPDSPHLDAIQELCTAAQAMAKPKACYRLAFVDSAGDDYVIVGGVRLTSRILRVNLERTQRVFVYLATAGQELEDWAAAFDDLWLRYCADVIGEMALEAAVAHVRADLTTRYRPGPTGQMAPGSLPDWPLTDQRPVFALLGDAPEAIGVRLTEGLMMVPRKSVSVLEFPDEDRFVSCQLCPREGCRSRRAPYAPERCEEKYSPGGSGAAG